MQVSDFHYELPAELIAQEPLPTRDASRMLVVSREKQSFYDDLFKNFNKYIRPGDCLVLNDSRVFPARLHGRRHISSGAEIEAFLLRPLDQQETVWSALVRPGKRVRIGDKIVFNDDVCAEVLSCGDFGERTLRFRAGPPVRELIQALGTVPLPPYIHRFPNTADRERYQTVFAQKSGSIAAPTAGLHFTPQMLESCREAGAEIACITLHVGLGTFEPIRQKNLENVRLHGEFFEISSSNAAKLNRAKRLFCVGTTTVRTLETAVRAGRRFAPIQAETDLFIYPGFHFQAAGAMLTNFHLPQSSLLMLVSAFAGAELILAAYRHAVADRYRFYSYGDCMLVE
ncbi:MAG: tRNA preQ1(34) S-adenosylmethionine ribosyltransferase-isomerase QueA [Bryobacteraceae bacterium]